MDRLIFNIKSPDIEKNLIVRTIQHKNNILTKFKGNREAINTCMATFREPMDVHIQQAASRPTERGWRAVAGTEEAMRLRLYLHLRTERESLPFLLITRSPLTSNPSCCPIHGAEETSSVLSPEEVLRQYWPCTHAHVYVPMYKHSRGVKQEQRSVHEGDKGPQEEIR